jgi:two-component system response regulator YesN
MGFKGERLWEADPLKLRRILCQVLADGNGTKICRDSHTKAVQESIRWGEAVIRKCCYSLMQIIVPVMDDGKLVGYLVASPFLLVDPLELQPDELPPVVSQGGKKRIFRKALSSIPVIRDEEANEAAKVLHHIADRLSRPDLSCLAKIHEIQELQGKIADQIRDLKALGKDFDPSTLTKLSYQEEKEIIIKIRSGDREGAKEILYRLLAIILSQYFENVEMLKISVLELLIFLFRAAVEVGGKMEEMLGVKYRFLTELASIRDQENLCLWVVKVFEKLIDNIYQRRNAKNYQRLKKTLDFIETNYHRPLTIEQIAREVFLSPSRLSHIIKSELGLTIGDCLSRVRMDKAKALLKDSEMPISQVALETGFPDQSYFTKVFKKFEKCTPKIFRQNVSQHKFFNPKMFL